MSCIVAAPSADRIGEDAPEIAHRTGVLVLVSSLRFGGAEKHAVALVNQLAADAFRASICHVKEDAHLADDLAPERRRDVVSLGVRGKFAWRGVRRLAQILQQRDVDIIMCTNGYPLLYAMLAAKLISRPVRLVEVLHTTIVNTGKSRAIMFLNKRLFRRCDLLVYVSYAQQQYWRERGMRAQRETVIQNGIDVERFVDRYTVEQKRERRAEFGFAPGDYVIGICAALRREKAHGDLLIALHRLRATGLDAKLLIIGDGEERAAVEQKIAELRLSGQAVISGFKADVRPYIACCDVMTLVSHAIETFSIAALESMALGKPVVLTRIGGAEEQVSPGVNGFLYEPGDIEALTGRLLALADPELRRRMGLSAARRVREHFTTERMVSAFGVEFQKLAQADAHAIAQVGPA